MALRTIHHFHTRWSDDGLVSTRIMVPDFPSFPQCREDIQLITHTGLATSAVRRYEASRSAPAPLASPIHVPFTRGAKDVAPLSDRPRSNTI